MNISPVSTKSHNFTSLYKTEDVLRLITGYPYKNQSTSGELIKSLTGVDLSSDSFQSSLPKDAIYLFSIYGIMDACSSEILKQHPELKTIYDSFDCQLHLKEGKKKQDSWFKEQLAKLDKFMDIKPFSLNKEDVRRHYKEIEYVFNKVI